MRFQTYTPPPPLAGLVEIFWLYEGYRVPHAKERVLPTGTMELVINLREDVVRVYDRDNPERCGRMPGGVLCGTQSEYFVIDTAEQESILGIHFKPGGAFPFFKLPAGELLDQQLSLDLLWGSHAAALLRERLEEAPEPSDKFRVLEQILLEQVVHPFQWHPAVSFALREFATVPAPSTMVEVSDRIGLSQRRFIEAFTDQVGLTPKLYCRIRRFQEVLRQVHGGGDIDWTETGLSCGYYDQAHFIRDFRAFSGLNPTTYLAQRGPHLNHVPLPDAQ